MDSGGFRARFVGLNLVGLGLADGCPSRKIGSATEALCTGQAFCPVL